MKKVLVTGAGGFLGRYATNVLARSGYRVSGVGRSPKAPSGTEDSVDWIQGDVSNLAFMTDVVAGKSIVVHLAGHGAPALSNQMPFDSFVNGPLMSLTAMEACRVNNVDRLIFASSGGTVYGPTSVVPTPEQHPTFGVGLYAVGKQVSEVYLREFERLYGVKGFSLRIANPFGSGQIAAGGQGLIAYALDSVKNCAKFTVYGDVENIRDLVYVEDVADAFVACANYTGEERVFNIGSGSGVSIKTTLDLLDEHLKPYRIDRTFAEARGVDIPRSILDVSKAKLELKWHPQTSFSDGIRKTVTSFLSSMSK